MRPRFVVEADCAAAEVIAALREHPTEEGERPVELEIDTRTGVLSVPEAERAFWSTHLGLAIEDGHLPADGGRRRTRVLGIFSPHPEIWTAYVVTIGMLVTLSVFGVMVAVVQLALGHTPWALLATLIAVLFGALVYTTTLVGQGLAADEMYRLRSHLDECVERAEARARNKPATAEDSAQL